MLVRPWTNHSASALASDMMLITKMSTWQSILLVAVWIVNELEVQLQGTLSIKSLSAIFALMLTIKLHTNILNGSITRLGSCTDLFWHGGNKSKPNNEDLKGLQSLH